MKIGNMNIISCIFCGLVIDLNVLKHKIKNIDNADSVNDIYKEGYDDVKFKCPNCKEINTIRGD